MLRLAIVEDEQIYIDQLNGYIRRYQTDSGTEIQLTVFRDGDEIVESYAGQFDIILMDIQMRFMDGMTAAEEIRRLDQSVIIIFITNMQQYAVRGYQVDALDYIVKPVEYSSFSLKLDRAASRVKKNEAAYIPIVSGGGIYKIVTSQILYIESEGHSLHFHTVSGELVSRMNMSEAEELLAGHGFFRCGKGYIVNLEKVDSFSEGICRIGEHRIPVSRSKKKDFLNVLTNYLSSKMF